ncbi:hypothetical protein [Sporomusa acidovorans]|uniref:Uncharacterized protein n=1 Tax=Sporomusa acidovorans (strain ATCC 49682 / DSM 3132 / Mol) TaxID=1123286 RepID=A0ABZ3J2J3_SPOA4|nr:hypothetical protein [Sporomusa acidovorans]OZC15768.1 hypothetical protein SPACI_46880 [Sporomusa acidovorans DSM 3132]SDF63126.1 hypothetical protein SAMN04488499_10649 [Sporomusa acidovorans]
MFSRVHTNSDILDNGKIMLLVDSEPGCYILTDLQYSEHAFQELLVDTHKAIQEARSTKNNFSLETYVNILTTLTNNLKMITESLLAVKAEKNITKGEHSTIITESYQEKSVEYMAKKIVVKDQQC